MRMWGWERQRARGGACGVGGGNIRDHVCVRYHHSPTHGPKISIRAEFIAGRRRLRYAIGGVRTGVVVGVVADGVVADGVVADGVVANGVVADGVAADVRNRRALALKLILAWYDFGAVGRVPIPPRNNLEGEEFGTLRRLGPLRRLTARVPRIRYVRGVGLAVVALALFVLAPVCESLAAPLLCVRDVKAVVADVCGGVGGVGTICVSIRGAQVLALLTRARVWGEMELYVRALG